MAQARRLLLRGASRLFNSSSPRPSLSSLTITRAFSDSKLFVGGLSFRTTEDGLRSAFAAHGEVMDVRIINDRETGKSRGFGFVTYYKEDDAETALSKLNGQILDGRSIRVDRASSRPPAPRAGGFGGGAGGGGENDNTITSMGFGEASESSKTADDWGSIPSLNADVPGSTPAAKSSFGSSSLDSDSLGSGPSSKSSFGSSSTNTDYSGSAKSSYGSSSTNTDYSGSAKSSFGSSSMNNDYSGSSKSSYGSSSMSNNYSGSSKGSYGSNYSRPSRSSYGNSSYGSSSYDSSYLDSEYSDYGTTPKNSYGNKSNTTTVGRKSTGGTLFAGDDSDGEGTIGGFGR